MKKEYLVLLSLLLLQACAFTPQTATLKPAVFFKDSTLGQGTEVYLQVTDERSDKVIGYRGAGWNGAAINTQDDVAQVIHDKISEGLTQKNFKVVSTKTPESRSLLIEIRNLQYVTSMGIFTGDVIVKAALKVLATYKETNYDQMYREEEKHEVFFIPAAQENEDEINDTLGLVIVDMFRDQKLFDYLLKPSPSIATGPEKTVPAGQTNVPKGVAPSSDPAVF